MKPPVDPVKLPLDRARAVAEKIAASIAEFCEDDKVAIAGSIRRGRPEVGDIDIVCLPKSLAALNELRARVRRSNPYTLVDGDQNLLLIYDDAKTRSNFGGPLQLDLFFAQHADRHMFGQIPANWGTLLMCRTGSKTHNIWLANSALHRGYRWNPYAGVFDGRGNCLASETEEDIYRVLEIKFIQPEDRER